MVRLPLTRPPIPAETARVAQAIFPEGNGIMPIRDASGAVLQTADFAPLFPPVGQPARDPACLALVTVFQFLAGLSERQAADHVRRCIAGKYALALPREDPGCDASVLRALRTRLLTGHAAQVLWDTVRTRLCEPGLLKTRGRHRTDSTHVLAAMRVLPRLTCVGETLRQALHDVATVAPAWLPPQIPPAWVER